MRLKQALSIMLPMMLIGCQQIPVADDGSPRSRIAVGSQIMVNKSLAVPAGHARVFLQFGAVVAKNKLDIYHPHCDFEMKQVSYGRLHIEPDTFTVTRVDDGEEQVVLNRGGLQHVAMRVGDGGGMISMRVHYVRHWLHSERQPDVMRMTCHGGFVLSEPFDIPYPSVNDIRTALGEYAEPGK